MAEFNLSGQELFGRYARIAYGHALRGKQDYHIYKCIQNFRSNCYCDIPLTYQSENNCYKHDEIVDVVNVIHCGLDENKVIRVAIKDIELIPTVEAKPVVHGHWIEQEDGNLDTYYTCSSCKEDFYLIAGTPCENLYNYCPSCGAKMDEPVEDDER